MSSSPPQVQLAFDCEDAMRLEYQRNLKAGGAFCPGVSGLRELDRCVLLLVHPITACTLELVAEVVFVKADDPGMGVGLHICDFGPAIQDKVQAFMQPSAPKRIESHAPERLDSQVTGSLTDDGELPEDPGAQPSPAQKLASSAMLERLRGLPVTAQIKLAKEGSLTERVALERMYGKSVWEALLKNQRVSPAEVARIARMGTATVSLLETIAANAAWLASGEVRRALLSNPRLAEDGVLRVLRATPKHELNLICNQTCQPPRVRRVAKTLAGKG